MARAGYASRIQERIRQLTAAISTAQAELEELLIAERVIGRLGNDDEMKGPEDGQDRTSTNKVGTVGDRAIEFLKSKGPADTPTILRFLLENWRSDLKSTTLASTLSRAKADGRIKSVNGVWQVVNHEKTEPPGGGSSEIDQDVDASDVDDDIRSMV